MLVTLYKIGEVYSRLLGTNGFHAKARNERFTAASSRCRQNLKDENFTSSFARLRKNNAPQSVLHLQHEYFSPFNQSNYWFLALSLTLLPSNLELAIDTYCKGRNQLNWLLNQVEFLVIFRISKDLKTSMSQNSLCLQNLLNHSFLVMSESFQMTPWNLWGLRFTDALLNNFHHILVSSSELCQSIVHCLILIFGLFGDLRIYRQLFRGTTHTEPPVKATKGSKVFNLFRDLGCVPIGWSGWGKKIQDHSASKEPINPFPEPWFIGSFDAPRSLIFDPRRDHPQGTHR